jgi:D-aminoacyl-tRNA deacylase
MRAVIQRSKNAKVSVNGETVGEIESGLVILLGVAPTDGVEQVNWLCEKLINLRIFEDSDGKMNLSLVDLNKECLVISQFTLYGNCRKGRRPSFVAAARPEIAEPLYEQFCNRLRELGVRKVAEGRFGAMMDVSLINDGPVTLIVDSKT